MCTITQESALAGLASIAAATARRGDSHVGGAGSIVNAAPTLDLSCRVTQGQAGHVVNVDIGDNNTIDLRPSPTVDLTSIALAAVDRGCKVEILAITPGE